ncbi:hypothetical protein INR49_031058 [Caranx melampygus]|nr:hypothetical protein INR49_031058 [Caranx melampygus]
MAALKPERRPRRRSNRGRAACSAGGALKDEDKVMCGGRAELRTCVWTSALQRLDNHKPGTIRARDVALRRRMEARVHPEPGGNMLEQQQQQRFITSARSLLD